MTMKKSQWRGIAGICLAMLAAGPAWGQQSAPPAAAPQSRNFDYWQPDWMVRELWGPGQSPKGMKVRQLRHSLFVQFGVPAEYAGAVSAVAAPSKDDLAMGRELFTGHCSSCHGKDGMGGGEGGKALSPSPALLAYMITRPVTVDEYLLWAISDGGAQFESEMPAFKDKLKRDEIWRVIAYMRAGFPDAGGGQKK